MFYADKKLMSRFKDQNEIYPKYSSICILLNVILYESQNLTTLTIFTPFNMIKHVYNLSHCIKKKIETETVGRLYF